MPQNQKTGLLGIRPKILETASFKWGNTDGQKKGAFPVAGSDLVLGSRTVATCAAYSALSACYGVDLFSTMYWLLSFVCTPSVVPERMLVCFERLRKETIPPSWLRESTNPPTFPPPWLRESTNPVNFLRVRGLRGFWINS